MWKIRFGWIGVAVTVGLLVLQGCGSDSSAPTQAEFVKEATAICRKGEEERGEVFKRLSQKYAGKQPSLKTREEAVLKLIEPYRQQTEQLAELTPPKGDEAQVEAIVAAMESGVERAEGSPASLLSSGSLFQKANKLATDYELSRCHF